MANWIRAYDPTRFIHYESGRPGPDISDVYSIMYPDLEKLKVVLSDPAEKRPVMMCEYAYAKGNSTGNFFKFWEMVDAFPRFQGGCIWDWNDKALLNHTAAGQPFFAYGGDFGPDFNYQRFYQQNEDPQMCCNGIVGPDLLPHPGAQEVKKIQAPVGLSLERGRSALEGRFVLWNKHQFRSLEHLDVLWEVVENGTPITHGRLPAGICAPGQKQTLDLPFRLPERLAPGAEYFLNVRFALNQDLPWAEKGHVIGWEQFALPLASPAAASPQDLPAVELRQVPAGYEIITQAGIFRIGAAAGTLTAPGGAITGPTENFYRAPTDIDLLMGNPPAAVHLWRAAGLDCLERSVQRVEATQINQGEVEVRVTSSMQAPGKPVSIRSEFIYRIDGRGGATIQHSVDAPTSLPFLPRVGMEFVLPEGHETVAWYGRGPHENYADRKLSAMLGRYTSPVDEQFTPYVYTSESGGKEDARWVALTRADGAGVLLIGLAPFHFDALHYTIQDLASAGHPHELTRLPETILHIDAAHMGVGGDDGWTAPVHKEFLVQPRYYCYTLRLVLLPAGKDLGF
jgi:beta-galactosidase